MSKREAPLEVPIWVAVPWSCCVCVVGSVPTLSPSTGYRGKEHQASAIVSGASTSISNHDGFERTRYSLASRALRYPRLARFARAPGGAVAVHPSMWHPSPLLGP